jgi:cytochrome c oxidase cbb3-type subunit 3
LAGVIFQSLENGNMQKKMPQSFRWLLLAGSLGFALACQSAPALDKVEVDTRTLFADSCAKCHGADGQAKTFRGRLLSAQNFTDTKWQTATTDEEISKTIKMGIKKMPAFEKKLSAAQIEALAAFVRTFKPAT